MAAVALLGLGLLVSVAAAVINPAAAGIWAYLQKKQARTYPALFPLDPGMRHD